MHDNKPKKHHYILVFYLKRWVTADDRICEFSRPYLKVVPRRTHPGAVWRYSQRDMIGMSACLLMVGMAPICCLC